MNDILIEKIKQLASDDLMIKAMRVLFAKHIEQEKPEIRDEEDNSIIGEKYRAYEKAKEIVNQVFMEVENSTVPPTKSKPFNKAT